MLPMPLTTSDAGWTMRIPGTVHRPVLSSHGAPAGHPSEHFIPGTSSHPDPASATAITHAHAPDPPRLRMIVDTTGASSPRAFLACAGLSQRGR